jgi:hypothetical protein
LDPRHVDGAGEGRDTTTSPRLTGSERSLRLDRPELLACVTFIISTLLLSVSVSLPPLAMGDERVWKIRNSNYSDAVLRRRFDRCSPSPPLCSLASFHRAYSITTEGLLRLTPARSSPDCCEVLWTSTWRIAPPIEEECDVTR